jgi:subtilisin family serine protease
MKRLTTFSIAVGLGVCLFQSRLYAGLSAGDNDASAAAARPLVDYTSAIVQLNMDPLSTYVKTQPAPGKKIDFSSLTVKSYRAKLMAYRNSFKTWLRGHAPAAKVRGQFDIALNAVSVELNGVSLDTIRKAPQVANAQPQGVYYPTTEDPDLALIKAVDAWALGGGPSSAGAEVKVAIIDTGIDVHHPCFSDTGYPNKKQIGDTRFTNNKIIAAKVFNNRAGRNHYTPEAIQEHGTHVAGTVACNYNTPASVEGVLIPHGISGVAPRALLGNYNIFPANVPSARSEDIFQALEAAYADGFDVANVSLGGGQRGIQNLEMVAVDNLDKANMVVAVAAGNNGPGLNTITSPGSAERALTAGASTVNHYIGTPVIVGTNTYAALPGEFATVSTNLTAPLSVVTSGGSPDLGCSALSSSNLTGRVALILRGGCSFSTKIRNAQAAGAVAVLAVNNVAGDPIVIGQDGTPNQPTIPAYTLSQADGMALQGSDGVPVTISATPAYFVTPNADFMADFSGEGPTDVDFRVKPDVVAPGVNVLSSIPLAYCGGAPCWAFFEGTSMATPHLAGSAAILRWLYPSWTAAQIRSAIVNTADRNVLKKFTSTALEHNVNIVGAGRENLLSAASATVTLDPVSVSFGAVPDASGQTKPFDITVQNVAAKDSTLSFAVDAGDASVSYFVSPTSLALKAGASGTVTVIMSAVKGAALGGHQSMLTVSTGTNEVAHAAIYTLIK